MKTSCFLLFSLMFTCNFAEASQRFETNPVTRNQLYKKMIHFNPLSLTVGIFDLGFEATTQAKESIYVDCGYYLSEAAGGLDAVGDYSNMNGLRIEMQYRFYRKNNNYIKNIFLAPYVNFKTLSADRTYQSYVYSPQYRKVSSTEKHTATTVSFGYMLGMRKSIFENIYMDLGIGGGVFIPVSGENQKELNIGLFNPLQKGVQFKASFGICIAL